MDTLLQDLRYATRGLLRSPGFTAAAVLTLALGIGANTGIFSLVNALVLRPPGGVEQPERLVNVYTSDFSGPRYGASSLPDLADFRASTRDVFSGVAAYTVRPLSLGLGGESVRAMGELVTGDYFRTLGVKPALGRFFLPEDDRIGAPPSVVIGHGFWQSELGGDPRVLGRTVRLEGADHAIIGVAPPEFIGSFRIVAIDAWVPVAAAMPDALDQRGDRGFFILARLEPDATRERAEARLAVVAERLHAAHPGTWTDVRDQARVVTVVPESEARVPPQFRGTVTAFLAMLLGVVGLVLLIACANVAGLLLARASGRQREMAVRAALGAGRRRLLRQLLTESALLGVMGGIGGVLLAFWMTDALRLFEPPIGVPIQLDLSLDGRVLAFAAVVAVGAGLLFGLAPALRALRSEPMRVLRDQGGNTRAGRRFGARDLLVVGQIGAALVLLVGASLFLRSLGAASAVDPGFETGSMLLVSLDLETEGVEEEAGTRLLLDLSERVAALPGVAAVALADRVPLGPDQGRRSVAIEGYSPAEHEDMEHYWNVVGPGYFEAMGVPLLRGRGFTDADRAGSRPVIVVNQAFARRFWGDENPIGKRLQYGPYESVEVVGVTATGKYRSLGEEPLPFMYMPFLQFYQGGMTLHVRTAGEPAAVLPAVRRELRALAGELPIASATTLREHLGFATLPQRLAGALLSAFGLLALLLAALGLYGVIAYAAAQRTREIGVRMALGARAGDVVRLVVTRGLVLTGAGVALGLLAALAVTRLISGFLFGVSAADPLTFLAVPLALAAVALLASWLPARRASRVDPLVALRQP